MTRPFVPHVFRTAATLDVEAIREDLEQAKSDLGDATSKRYTHSKMVLNWVDLDHGSTAAERAYKYSVSFAHEVVGVELHVYGTSGETFTLTCDQTGVGWSDISVVGLGTSTLASNASEQGVTLASGTTITFTVDSAAATWGADITAVVHLRYDRHGGTEPSVTVPVLDASKTDDPAPINTFTSALSTAVSTDGANSTAKRIEVYTWPHDQSAYSTGEDTIEVPDYGDLIYAWYVGVVADNTRTVSVALKDETGSTVSTLAPTPGGISSLDVDSDNLTEQQPGSGHATVANNYSMVVTLGGTGSLYRLYAVLEFQE